jgi:Ca-activated chloride channel family protein
VRALQRILAALLGLLSAFALVLGLAFSQEKVSPKSRVGRPEELGRGYVFQRDPETGELRRVPVKTAAAPGAPAEAPPEPATIRTQVNLIEIACNVLAPDGSNLRGLTARDFRIYEDGAEQTIAHFDASSDPAGIVLILDASPSIFRELAQMKSAARSLAARLSPADEIAVVSFSAQAHLLLPFSRDRALLEKALDSQALARVENSSKSNIYQAVYLAATELFSNRTGRKAIVLLTDGQDSGLGLTWQPWSAFPKSGAQADRLTFDDVARALAARGIELYAVSTETRPRAMTDGWLAAHSGAMLVTDRARSLGMPPYTVYLAELVRRVGGRLYFLREIGTLIEVYRRIAETLSSQYNLGFYSSAPLPRPGWHALRIELPGHPEAHVLHRSSYYLPAGR